MTFEEELVAPISSGEELGRLDLLLDDTVLASSPLVARGAVAEGSLFVQIRDHIKMHWRD